MIIDGTLTQPLVLDVAKYKQQFKAAKETSFERCNRIATENKLAKWAAYRPLAAEQLYDTIDDNISVTILSPFASRAPKRSTSKGLLYAQLTVIHRPTEILAILHSMGLFKFESEDYVERQEPNIQMRWCITCKASRPIALFAKDRSNPSGLAFCCIRCQKDLERGVWRKAA